VAAQVMVGGAVTHSAATPELPVAASPQGTERMAYTRSPDLCEPGLSVCVSKGQRWQSLTLPDELHQLVLSTLLRRPARYSQRREKVLLLWCRDYRRRWDATPYQSEELRGCHPGDVDFLDHSMRGQVPDAPACHLAA